MASGPWDNVQLQGPPNGPAWAQAAAQMLGAVNGAVNNSASAFRNMSDWGYQQQQRNFFQDPQNQQLLTNFMQQPNKQNYAALIQPMIQAGGMQAAGPMLDQYLGITQDENIANRIGGGGQSGQAPNPTTPPAVYGVTGKVGDQPQTRIPYGVDSSGAPNLNILAANYNIPEAALNTIAKRIGVSSPEDDLNQSQQTSAKNQIKSYLASVRGGTPVNNNPVAQSGGGDEEAASSNQLNPSTGQGSPTMTPRQGPERRIAQAAAQPQPAQPAPSNFNERFGASGDRSGERPSPLGDMAKVNAMNTRIQQLRADAARYARKSPAAAQQADKAADDLIKERDKVLESISKYNEPGREQRDVESGAKLKGAQIANDTERYGKQYDAYQTRADQARELVSTNSVTKSIMNAPGFYSGAGAEHVLAMQRLGVALGLAPKDYAMANEVFGKTVSTAIMNQIKSLQGLGQVRVAEINIMKQAAENHDNSPSSNRTLAEIQDRLAKNWTIPIAEAAQKYNGGHLDAGFDKIKTDIMRKPLFTPDELVDPRRIAPIEVRSPAELKSHGWRDGEPFKDANTGRIFTHLPKGAPPPAPVNPANQT